MSKAYWINSETRQISEITITDLADLQKHVGGYIEVAYEWPNGDVLYVDEEGMLKQPASGFVLLPERADQVLAGNGVMVGREIGDTIETAAPTMTRNQLVLHVRWWSL